MAIANITNKDLDFLSELISKTPNMNINIWSSIYEGIEWDWVEIKENEYKKPLDLEIRKHIIKLFIKAKGRRFREFEGCLQHIFEILNEWLCELELITHTERCHACQKFLGYPYYDWDDFLEVNSLYCCDFCGEIYCKKCGNIHKKRHIDERRLEMYEAKKIYRSKKLKNKTIRLQNEQFHQTQITNDVSIYSEFPKWLYMNNRELNKKNQIKIKLKERGEKPY